MEKLGSDLYYNWAALMVSIIKVCEPEDAFEALETGKVNRDIDELRLLKKEFTYKEIQENYMFPSASLVHKTISRGRGYKDAKAVKAAV
jgi:hypothetical protein